MRNTCPFCDTAQKYRYIMETDSVLAMYAKSPACRYHILLMPKRHAPTLDSLNESEILELHQTLQTLVDRARSKLPGFIGYNVLSNNGGPAVRQRVPHCHVHLFLRVAEENADPFTVQHKATASELTAEQMSNLKELQQILR